MFRSLVVYTAVLVLCAAGAELAAGQERDAIGWPEAEVINNMTLKNNSGVWWSMADQFSMPVWDAYFVDTMLPDCSNATHGKHFIYKHHTISDPAIMAMWVNDTSGIADVVVAHHKDTQTWKIVKSQGFILFAQSADGETWCMHWKPYIDLGSGELRAQSISKTEWVRGSDGKVTNNDLTCSVKDYETAGCYPQGPNKVHSVSVATYTCKNGNCAAFSPLMADHENKE